MSEVKGFPTVTSLNIETVALSEGYMGLIDEMCKGQKEKEVTDTLKEVSKNVGTYLADYKKLSEVYNQKNQEIVGLLAERSELAKIVNKEVRQIDFTYKIVTGSVLVLSVSVFGELYFEKVALTTATSFVLGVVSKFRKGFKGALDETKVQNPKTVNPDESKKLESENTLDTLGYSDLEKRQIEVIEKLALSCDEKQKDALAHLLAAEKINRIACFKLAKLKVEAEQAIAHLTEEIKNLTEDAKNFRLIPHVEKVFHETIDEVKNSDPKTLAKNTLIEMGGPLANIFIQGSEYIIKYVHPKTEESKTEKKGNEK